MWAWLQKMASFISAEFRKIVHLRLTWGDNICEITPPNKSNISENAIILPCKKVN